MVKDCMISPQIRNKSRNLLLPLLFDTVLLVLAKTIRQEKKIKGIKIEKEGVTFLFSGNLILPTENFKKFILQLLELISSSCLADPNSHHKNKSHFCSLEIFITISFPKSQIK